MAASDILVSGQRKAMAFEIDISNDQTFIQVDIKQLTHAIAHALQVEHVASAVISVSIVDNAAIHVINREHLQHDYPTDVISFQLDFGIQGDEDDDHEEEDDEVECTVDHQSVDPCSELRAQGAMIEGEIIASAQMAAEMASSGQWTAMHELTLYVVHGLLHICGYDDLTPGEKRIMRGRERAVLQGLGLQPVYPDDE